MRRLGRLEIDLVDCGRSGIGIAMPPMTRSRVDLRAAFGPSRPVTSPAGTRAVTSCKLGTAPIEMEKPRLSAGSCPRRSGPFFEEAGASAARQFGAAKYDVKLCACVRMGVSDDLAVFHLDDIP